MNQNIVLHIIKVTVCSAIPSFLSYTANSSLFLDKLQKSGFLGESVNIPVIQDHCLWISIALSAVFLSFNLLITKIKYDQILEQRNLLIKMNKNVISVSLGKRFLSETEFDIRIFIPKHPLLYRLLDFLDASFTSKKLKFPEKFKIPKKFIIKNIDLIADQGNTKNLQFEVEPNPQGLVGFCYNSKSMVYDDDLEHTNESEYDLKEHQISRTSNLKWSICCPIFDNNDVVVAILALDGKTKIKIDKEKEAALREEIVAFSRMLFDSVPQLFKR